MENLLPLACRSGGAGGTSGISVTYFKNSKIQKELGGIRNEQRLTVLHPNR